MRLFSVILATSLLAMSVHRSDASGVNSGVGAMARVLEDQLTCAKSPEPGAVIRRMLKMRLLKDTGNGGDGIPIFVPTSPLIVFGKRVTFVAGWQYEVDGDIERPFGRGPGTAPPIFLAASFKENPSDISYKPRETRYNGPFSTIETGSLDYSSGGSTITCYAQ